MQSDEDNKNSARHMKIGDFIFDLLMLYQKY